MPNRKKRVTIKDVALAAGVSTQTVSRVINKEANVSEDTRRHVKDVVDQLGYIPSTLARSLIQQRSYTLGIVTFGLKYIGPARTLNGIADKADELGYMLLMKELHNLESNSISEVIDSLIARQVDGILMAVPEIGSSHSWLDERMAKITVPVVFLALQPREAIQSISTDNFQGALTALKHLLESGKRKIGHVSGPMDWWEAQERKRGWRFALEEAGLESPEKNSVEGNWSSASGEQAFLQLLENFPEMDAVFVANDQMALSVLRETCRRGISVPDQLAVIGFDNNPESAYFYPALTTVAQDLQMLGECAVQKIVEMIEARRRGVIIPAASVFLLPTLVVRESA